ncbi:hypothetical protein ACB371_17440 [Klebsiella pneumoniae]
MRKQADKRCNQFGKATAGAAHATGWLFSGGRNIDSLLNQQLLTHMAAGPKPQHLTRSGMRKRGTPQEECPLFLQEVLPDYYYPLELKHPEQYTRPDI